MAEKKALKIEADARYKVRVNKPYPVPGTAATINPGNPSNVSGTVAQAMWDAGVVAEIEKV